MAVFWKIKEPCPSLEAIHKLCVWTRIQRYDDVKLLNLLLISLARPHALCHQKLLPTSHAGKRLLWTSYDIGKREH